MPAIELTHLTKIYQRSHLGKVYRTLGVEDITLAIQPGETFGLLGLNGSGKTTTIKLILGLLKPTAGAVTVAGHVMPSSEGLKKIGYLPEVPYFYKYLTAREILKFYGELSGISDLEKRVDTIIEMVGLTERAHKRLSEFSKGMLQRIGLAQSLLHDPDILVYDEPVSGLDPLAMSEMRDLLLHFKARGKTIFLSSHLISEVERICDRVAILARGRLVRSLHQSEWKAQGGLEKIFVNDVAASSEMGRIKIS